MTIDAPAGVAVIETPAANRDQSSYVDWPAIMAGIVLASAISLVLISFGSAVGLNFLDFGYGDGPNPIFVGIAAASWFLWVQISSFMAGGYLTGRLRRRYFDATEDESDLRDGAHGLLVWAGAAILGSIIAVGGIGAAASAVGSAAATVTTAASNVADDAAVAIDPTAYYVDTLFRPATGAAAPGTEVSASVRDEAGRLIGTAVANDLTFAEADKVYLADLIEANTGVDEPTAINRIDAGFETLRQARDAAVEAARIARNTAIIGAFLLAASLLISAIGAFWAAQKGGNHRDKNTVFADVFRRF